MDFRSHLLWIYITVQARSRHTFDNNKNDIIQKIHMKIDCNCGLEVSTRIAPFHFSVYPAQQLPQPSRHIQWSEVGMLNAHERTRSHEHGE